MNAYRKSSINYGLILGVFLILVSTLIYSIDLDLMTNTWVGVANFVIVIGFGIFSAINAKKILGGFMTFKEAFVAFFLTIFFGFLLSTIFSILLFNVIDTEAKTVLTENVIRSTVKTMENFGTPSSDVAKMAEEMEKSDSFGPLGQLQGFLFMLVFYSVIGLIVALIVKRERPQSL